MKINIEIDGKKYSAKKGQTITEAARSNNVYLPTLCDFKGINPAGTCRICSVKINGIIAAACTTEAVDGMIIENNTEELNDLRKSIIEMLYVEGNHQCAACEKSGNCDLQGLAYRFKVLVPRFPYQFPFKKIEKIHKYIMIDPSRCIQCLRCLRGVKSSTGRPVFRMERNGKDMRIRVIPGREDLITEKIALNAVDMCPVGAILSEKRGFSIPIGHRKYDKKPAGDY